jgi:transposase
LHLEYKQAHPDGWGYTQFCNDYHRWLERQDVVMRFEYPAGERMFVDFCGDTLPITDPDTGEVCEAQVFVSALAASGYMYVEARGSQDLASWLGTHVHALEFYSACPRVVVPDNLKSGVTKACWYDPDLNPSYLELAQFFNVSICRAGRTTQGTKLAHLTAPRQLDGTSSPGFKELRRVRTKPAALRPAYAFMEQIWSQYFCHWPFLPRSGICLPH